MPVGAETPIFLGDEWDNPPVCEYCDEKIDITLIEN